MERIEEQFENVKNKMLNFENPEDGNFDEN